jgi:rhamnosyltransferase
VTERACAIPPDAVAAVVVTYGPDTGFPERLARTAGQVGRVIMVDNRASESAQRALRGLRGPRVELIENPRNLGVGAALNQGVRRAAALGYAWVLTLDQDSEIDADLVDGLARVYAACPFGERVGLLNANARSRHSGQVAVRCRPSEEGYTEAATAITSGSLVRVRAYEEAGPYREDFFIDGVDLEHCLRLRRLGWRILVACRPLMTHAAGSMAERRVGRRVVVVPNAAPWRYYYVTRNLLRIFGAYAWREPGWVALAAVNMGKTVVKMVLFEDHRAAKFGCMTIGAWDAVTGSRRNRFLRD